MDLSNIPTHLLHEELNHREDILKEEKKVKEELEQQHRVAWLKTHGGMEGNDLCGTCNCRIDCTGCDDYEEDVYTPL